MSSSGHHTTSVSFDIAMLHQDAQETESDTDSGEMMHGKDLSKGPHRSSMSGKVGSSLEVASSRDLSTVRLTGGNPYAPACEYASQLNTDDRGHIGGLRNSESSIRNIRNSHSSIAGKGSIQSNGSAIGNPYAPACLANASRNNSTGSSYINSNRTSSASAAGSTHIDTHTDILHQGQNRTNQTDLRRDREEKADTLSKFSQQSFWLVLLFSFVITFSFTITNLVLLADATECQPHHVSSSTIVCVSGALHLITLGLYIWQVYKHRDNILIKSRGRQFLIQICVLAPLVIVVSVLLSLTYLGTLTNVCIYSNELPWDNLSDAVLFCLYSAVRFITTMFLAAIIARQRLLYLLFIHKATRSYSKKALSRQYTYTNLAVFAGFIIAEVPYIVMVLKDGKGENGSPIGAALSSQVGFVAILLVVFSFYAYKTRKIELTFSDWGANVRVLSMFSVTNMILAILLAVKGANLALGLLTGAVEMFVVTAYMMDSFSALLVCIHYGIEKTVVPTAVQLPSLSNNLRSASRALRGHRRSDDTEVGSGKTLGTIASGVSDEYSNSDEHMGNMDAPQTQYPVNIQLAQHKPLHASNAPTVSVVREGSADETT